MYAAFYIADLEHHHLSAALMSAGMQRHGVKTSISGIDDEISADLVVVWGWRRQTIIESARRAGVPVLVMERGHIQPRMEWISCGFNGLAGRGLYPSAPALDNGARWGRYFAHHLKPWRDNGDYILICGQIPGDAALNGVDIHHWAQETIDGLQPWGRPLRYRAHPGAAAENDFWEPSEVVISRNTLAEDLAHAETVITYNSTTAIEAVLEGIPVVTFEKGSMAWAVTTHDLTRETLIRPDRTQWCHDLAWTQWLPEEIRDGTAWECLQHIMPSGFQAL